MITLYHNTTYKNALSILESGLKISYSKSQLASGYQMTWASNHPVVKYNWGGNIVKFFVTDKDDYEKVNDDQYIIYNDIPANQIIDVDFMIGTAGTGYMHLSELPEYIDEYGVDEVREVLYEHHNEDIPLKDLIELTPELHWEDDDNIKLEHLYEANDYVDYNGEQTRLYRTSTTNKRTGEKRTRYFVKDKSYEPMTITDDDINADIPDRINFIAYKQFNTLYNPNDPSTKRYRGMLFPLYVGAKEKDGIRIGQWYKCGQGELRIEVDKDGNPIPGGLIQVDSKLGNLAYRPGWHLASLPVTRHIGPKGSKTVVTDADGNIVYGKNGKPKQDYDAMYSQTVWAKVEYSAKYDFSEKAMNQPGVNGDAKKAMFTNRDDFKNGFYNYKTNSNASDEENWIIADAIRVVSVLSDETVERIAREGGMKAQKRWVADGTNNNKFIVDFNQFDVVESYRGRKDKNSRSARSNMKISKYLTETTGRDKATRLFKNPSYMSNIKTFAILTGENPDAHSETRSVNKELNKKLQADIKDIVGEQHMHYYKIKGKYGDTEHSYLIYNITLSDAKLLSANAHQQSFIFGTNEDGTLHFEFWANRKRSGYDYIKVDEQDLFVSDPDFEDYYTKLSKDFKFNIPFDKFEVSADRMIEFFNTKLANTDYAEDFEYNMQKSLDEALTHRGRDLYRMKLYGNKFYN